MAKPSAPAASVPAAYYPPVFHAPDQGQACAEHPDDVKYWVYPEHRGWLLSQAKFLKDWRRRFYVLKQGFLFKLPSDDLSPENRYKIAWSMKDCIDVSFPPVDEAKGPTLNLIMKKGYKANGREPELETVVLVADSAEERNLWFGALVAAKSKRQFQFQFNAAVGLPSGPASLSAGHAANVYGDTIAEELSKLRLDMSDIKKDVSTMKVENRENADAILDQAERIEDTVGSLADGIARDNAYGTDGGYGGGYTYGSPTVSSIHSDSYELGSFDSGDEDVGFAPFPPPPPPKAFVDPADNPTEIFGERCIGVQNSFAPHEWVQDGLCGKRIRVLWRAREQRLQAAGNTRSTGKEQWWAGYVKASNPTRGLHMVQYDDGEVECLNLGKEGTLHTIAENGFGPKDIGRRVEVFWAFQERHQLLSSKSGSTRRHCNASSGKWYAGTISECRRHRFSGPEYSGEDNYQNFKDVYQKFISDAAVIKYDDGDVELLDLNQYEFRYISSPRVWQGQKVSLLTDNKLSSGGFWSCTVVTAPKHPGEAAKVVFESGIMTSVDLKNEDPTVATVWHMKEADVIPFTMEENPSTSGGAF